MNNCTTRNLFFSLKIRNRWVLSFKYADTCFPRPRSNVLTRLLNVLVEESEILKYTALSFYYESIDQNHLLNLVHRIKNRISFHKNMALLFIRKEM